MAARNRISLVGKTLGVLEALAETDAPAQLKDIAGQVGLVKSSVYRILYSLKELGYVEQVEGTGGYILTWRMHTLLRKGAARMTLLDLARPHMVRLRDEVEETVWLAEWRQGACVVVGGVEVSHRLRFSIDIGSPVGLHSTALGKAIAAFLPPKALAAALGTGKLAPSTRYTITNRAQLRAELSRVRQTGFAINQEESIEGLIAVAAPIFDSRGDVLASVTVGSPIFRSSRVKQKAVISATIQAANAITADLVNVQFETSERRSPQNAVAV
jgi:IclR family transcriptional regulator, acetate operon repressor